MDNYECFVCYLKQLSTQQNTKQIWEKMKHNNKNSYRRFVTFFSCRYTLLFPPNLGQTVLISGHLMWLMHRSVNNPSFSISSSVSSLSHSQPADYTC